jgi:hypothetical protein
MILRKSFHDGQITRPTNIMTTVVMLVVSKTMTAKEKVHYFLFSEKFALVAVF